MTNFIQSGAIRTLIRKTDQQMPQLARELRENLDSTSMDTFMNFLSGSPKRKDIPARCGYYIGMLVARELNRKHSLRELARLRDQQLRKEIESALIKLESRKGKLNKAMKLTRQSDGFSNFKLAGRG
jgi:predicted metal-dependent hydrolase